MDSLDVGMIMKDVVQKDAVDVSLVAGERLVMDIVMFLQDLVQLVSSVVTAKVNLGVTLEEWVWFVFSGDLNYELLYKYSGG
mgnify:FL=1